MSETPIGSSLNRRQLITLYILGAGVMVGQLVRLPLAGNLGSALSFLDLALLAAWVIELGAWVVNKGKLPGLTNRLDRFWLAFQVVLLATFVLALLRFGSNWQVAAAYQLRLQAYLSLYWLMKSWQLTEAAKLLIWRYLIALAVILSVVGFVQLVKFSDFALLNQFGWDPHSGRLTSTWLDPNYFGGFLALALTLILAKWLTDRTNQSRARTTAVFLVVVVAAYFCYSRSGWGSLIIMTSLLGFRANWKVGLVVCLALTGMLFSPTRLGGRFSDAVGSTRIDESGAVVVEDATSEDRVDSWQRGLKVAQSAPILGVGYNNYGQAALRLGELKNKDLKGHSSQGSDSSLLNVWATTGLVGVALFIGILVMLAKGITRRPQTALDHYQLAVSAGLIGLIVDSFFINSLFYGPILAIWVILAATVQVDD